jgi:hypothetical protein
MVQMTWLPRSASLVSWMILLGTGPRVRQGMIFAELSLDEQLLALLWQIRASYQRSGSPYGRSG